MTERLDPVRVRVSLDRLQCHDDGDGYGDAEPYRWTIFFEVDGETVEVGPNGMLRGRCKVSATPGSHGNLGTDRVDAGDVVIVPSAIGEVVDEVTPIPVAEALGGGHVAGHVGVLAVLMEEDFVSDDGAESGRQVLVETFELVLNGMIQELGILKPVFTDADKAQLAALVRSGIPATIRETQTTWENVTSWLNEDDQIGFVDFTFSQLDLAMGATPLSHRFKATATSTAMPIGARSAQMAGVVLRSR